MAVAARQSEGSHGIGEGQGLPPVDLVHLARQTHGDRALECEILAMFSTVCKTYLEKIAATDAADRSLALHAIKGAAAGVGAFELVAIAKSAEAAFKAQSFGRGEIDAIAGEVGRVRAYIDRLICA